MNQSDYTYDYDYDPGDLVPALDELALPLAVYGLTFVLGVVGNILILLAVTVHRQGQPSSPTHVFLASMATADLLLILLCLPLKVE